MKKNLSDYYLQVDASIYKNINDFKKGAISFSLDNEIECNDNFDKTLEIEYKDIYFDKYDELITRFDFLTLLIRNDLKNDDCTNNLIEGINSSIFRTIKIGSEFGYYELLADKERAIARVIENAIMNDCVFVINSETDKLFLKILFEYKNSKVIIGIDKNFNVYDIFNISSIKFLESFALDKVIEIVPNYSEGKDKAKMMEIIKPFLNDDFDLVSLEMDPSYNRSVLTVIGKSKKVIKAMFESVKISKDLINLNYHKGEHLRIGAVDILPIVPIRNISIRECVAISKILGKKINDELDIPVYLYNLSCEREEHRLFPNLRKGEFEGLEKKMENPIWYPDYGKNHPHPTFGVITIGCRKPLIAFNVDLDTNDIKIARSISRKIRYSNGGHKGIQAREAFIYEKGIVQVSMNITDYHDISIYEAFCIVKKEALNFNVRVIGSEIIGLVFEEAIIDSIKRTSDFDSNKKMSFDDYVSWLEKNILIHDFSSKKILGNVIKNKKEEQE